RRQGWSGAFQDRPAEVHPRWRVGPAVLPEQQGTNGNNSSTNFGRRRLGRRGLHHDFVATPKRGIKLLFRLKAARVRPLATDGWSDSIKRWQTFGSSFADKDEMLSKARSN